MTIPDFSYKSIDIHSHFNHGSPYETSYEPLAHRDLEFVLSRYDSLGIKNFGMSTFASVEHTECIEAENDYLHNLVQKYENMYQWVVLDPRNEKTLQQAEHMLGHPKVLGIKIHPVCHGYDIEKYGDTVFSFAHKHHAVVLIHPDKYSVLLTYANQYSNLKLESVHTIASIIIANKMNPAKTMSSLS